MQVSMFYCAVFFLYSFFLIFFYNISDIISDMAHEKKVKGGKTSQFIGKLTQMFQDQSNSRILKYDTRTKKLIIFSRTRLQNILPLYFKHSNFQSFARQLNWFGFEKIRSPRHHVFQNAELKKGKRLCDLQSKRKNKKCKKQEFNEKSLRGSDVQAENSLRRDQKIDEITLQSWFTQNQRQKNLENNYFIIYFPNLNVTNWFPIPNYF